MLSPKKILTEFDGTLPQPAGVCQFSIFTRMRYCSMPETNTMSSASSDKLLGIWVLQKVQRYRTNAPCSNDE
jgi:hypothetical protein